MDELCRRGVRARSVGGRVRRQLCPHGGARGRVGSRTCGFVWDRGAICEKTRTEWTVPGLRPHPARVASPAHASHPHLPSPPCLVMQIFIKGAGKTFTLNVMPSDTTEILKQKAS